MSQRSDDFELHVETSDYQPYVGDETEKIVPECTANSKRHLHLLYLSIGLLCFLQAVLNIALRVGWRESTDRTGTPFPNVTRHSTTWVALWCKACVFPLSNAAVLLCCKTGRDTPCYTSWQMFSSSCYYVSSRRGSWHSANQDCLERGAHLVIVNHIQELRFVKRLARDPTASWIGMTDLRTEGSWRWLDGTPVTPDRAFWARGQPDGAGEGEDCGEIHALANFSGFNDYPCSTRLTWICEKTPSPVEHRRLE